MNTRYLQQGMGMGQIILILVVIGFGATVAVSMIPVYMDNNTAKSTLQSVQEFYAGKDMADVTNNNITSKLNSYFQVNMISNDIKDAIEIVREGDEVWLTINYEVRKPIVGNVDVIMTFENEVVLGE